MLRGRSQLAVLLFVALTCAFGYLVTMLYWGVQHDTVLGGLEGSFHSVRRWSAMVGQLGSEQKNKRKQVEWKLYGEEFMTERELSEIRRAQNYQEQVGVRSSLLRSIRQSSFVNNDQAKNLTRLSSISAQFQHQLESSWPLNCHPSAEGLLPLKYERFAKALEDYSKFHRKSSPKLSTNKADPARVLVWQCSTLDYCGGLADRMKGIAYSLLLAIFSRRRLIINWDDKYVEPNLINWKDDVVYEMLKSVDQWKRRRARNDSTSSEDTGDDNERDIFYYQEDIVDSVRSELYTKLGTLPEYPYELRMFSILGGTGIDNSEGDIIYNMNMIGGQAKYVFLSTNLEPCTLKDSYKNGNQQWIMDGLKWVGLDHLSPEEIDDTVGMVMRYMFRVKRELLEEVTEAGRTLALSGQLYTSLHIRTGFAGSVELHESIQLPKFVRDKPVWAEMLKCAVQTADSSHGPSSPILLATDSMIIKHMAVSKYGGRFRTLNNRLLHVDKIEKIPHPLQNDEVEGVLFTWVDMLLLAESHVLVGGTSGYVWAANLFCYLPNERRINAETCKIAL